MAMISGRLTMTVDTAMSAAARIRMMAQRLGAGEGLGIVFVVIVLAVLVLFLALDSTGTWLYQQSEFVVSAVFFAVLAVAGEVGHRLGRRTLEQAREATESHTNEMQTTVFAVLGLLLAFTFSIALGRFDTRKQAVVTETNAISTAYLQTQLLPAAQQAAAADILRHYTDARLASERPGWEQDAALKRETKALQLQLWAQAVAAVKQDPQSQSIPLFAQSVNALITAQITRDAARLDYVPGIAVYLLFAVSILGVAMLGYRFGIRSGRSVLVSIMLPLLIAVLLLIILDLDHPYGGFITIGQQTMIELRQSMGSP
jgi:hypothetical protein